MNFFPAFMPIAPRSPIADAMNAQKAVIAYPLVKEVYDAVMALPDEEKALVADLMRALPDLTAPDSEGRRWGKGDAARMRLEQFIDDPRRVRELTDIIFLNFLHLDADVLARVGRAVFIPDMDEEVSRAERFGPERSEG